MPPSRRWKQGVNMFKHETDFEFDGLEVFAKPRLVVSGFLRIGFNSQDDWSVESIDGSRFDGPGEIETPLNLEFAKGGLERAFISVIVAAVLTRKPRAIGDAIYDAVEHRGDPTAEHSTLNHRQQGLTR